MPKSKLLLVTTVLAMLVTTVLTSNCANWSGEEDVITFDNPPESQRTLSPYSPSGVVQSTIELDHYMLGVGEDPLLHISYENISGDTIQLELYIEWTIQEETGIKSVRQGDLRPSVLPGRGEKLIYKPRVYNTSSIVGYLLFVHFPQKAQLPWAWSNAPRVGPTEAVGIGEEVVGVSKPLSSIEVANFDLSELIELRQVVEEVISSMRLMANEDERSLLNQAEMVLETIQSDSKLRNIVAEKTEEEKLILSILGGIFSVGVEHFYNIPSPVAWAIAKGTEELGNQIAEWQVLGHLSLATVTQPDSGIMEVVYEKQEGEIWVNFDIHDPVGKVAIYVSVEPRLVSSEGTGNMVLSEGVRPVMEKCRIAYRFGSLVTKEPESAIDELEAAETELANVQSGVRIMMFQNGLSELPNPVTIPTNDMSAFPDTSICGIDKLLDFQGNAYVSSYDKDGYTLYKHDAFGDADIEGYVNYVEERYSYTEGTYTVDEYGVVTQVTTGYE